MNEVKFESALTKEDWLTFNKIYHKIVNKKRRIIILSIGCLAISISVFYSILLILSVIKYHAFYAQQGYGNIFTYQRVEIINIVIYLALAVLLFYRYFKGIERTTKKMLNNPENQLFFNKKEITINSEQIQAITNLNEVKYTWLSVTKVIETKQFIAVFVSSSSCLLVNKNALSPEQIQDFQVLLQANFTGKVLQVEK